MRTFCIQICTCLSFLFGQTDGYSVNAQTVGKDDNVSKVSLLNERIKAKGNFKGLVILAEFADTPFTLTDANLRFGKLLNECKYSFQGAHGSAKDYFITNSDSTFCPSFDVIGPVRLPKEMSYYGKNGENGEEIHAGEMVMEACRLASSQTELSDYDSNNDGLIDLVYIFFASYGENENPNVKELIWSHAGNIADSCLTLDGKRIGRYACSSEYIGKTDNPNRQMATIGTFCHEFSHILGLPDFYNTLSGSGMTPGSLSIMDKGNYLDEGKCPAGYSAFEKEYVDWIKVPVLTATDSITRILLSPVNSETKSDEPCAVKIRLDKDEYLYLENRQNESWDRHLPGAGLLIYHVDLSDSLAWDRNEVNTRYSQPNYDLIRANGKYETDYKKVFFPGDADKTTFIPPKSRSGEKPKFKIENIEKTGKYIAFDYVKP